jgi:hypothetical protein
LYWRGHKQKAVNKLTIGEGSARAREAECQNSRVPFSFISKKRLDRQDVKYLQSIATISNCNIRVFGLHFDRKISNIELT